MKRDLSTCARCTYGLGGRCEQFTVIMKYQNYSGSVEMISALPFRTAILFCSEGDEWPMYGDSQDDGGYFL